MILLPFSASVPPVGFWDLTKAVSLPLNFTLVVKPASSKVSLAAGRDIPTTFGTVTIPRDLSQITSSTDSPFHSVPADGFCAITVPVSANASY